MEEPHPLTIPILEQAGFGQIAKLRHLKVDHALVTSLVERWRPETHTFHFPTGDVPSHYKTFHFNWVST